MTDRDPQMTVLRTERILRYRCRARESARRDGHAEGWGRGKNGGEEGMMGAILVFFVLLEAN